MYSTGCDVLEPYLCHLIGTCTCSKKIFTCFVILSYLPTSDVACDDVVHVEAIDTGHMYFLVFVVNVAFCLLAVNM